MKIYLIDNFDSFTYNLVHLLREVGIEEVLVRRNDVISVEEALTHDAILISPGPGVPRDSGKLMEFLAQIVGKRPLFGVCLGMQALGELYGGELKNLSRVYHGVATEVNVLDRSRLFQEMPEAVSVGRYHSWVVERESIPEELIVTAEDEDGEAMAFRHAHLPVYAVQFHPESVLTPQGAQLLENFIQIAVQTAVQS